MNTPRVAGITVGTLFLCQMLVGIYINFSLLQPLTGEPGFLHTGAAGSVTFGIAALAALASASVNLIVASISYRIFNTRSPALALLAVAFAAVGLTLTAVEYTRVLELVSYSQQYQAATPETKALLETLKPVVAASRNWAHFMAIGTSGFSLFIFYLMLFRASATPRLLTGYGVLAAATQVCAVSQAFIDNSIPLPMLMPLALAQLVLPLYFIVRGLGARAGVRA